MRPGGAGASGRTPSPMTPHHSTTTPTPLSPQTLDGLGGWHLFLAHVPLCTELEEGQEEAGSTLWWPSAGHRGVGSCLLSASLCIINTLSSGLFHLLLLPPENHCKLRPQVTVSQGHPSLPQAAQGEGAPQRVMSCGCRSRSGPSYLGREDRVRLSRWLKSSGFPARACVPGLPGILALAAALCCRLFFLGPQGSGSVLCPVCDAWIYVSRRERMRGASLLLT